MATRPQKTRDEIQAEVHRRVHEGKEVQDDGAAIKVPVPTAFAAGTTDPETGANWTMSVFGGATGYEGWVLHCLKSVQTTWDLHQ